MSLLGKNIIALTIQNDTTIRVFIIKPLKFILNHPRKEMSNYVCKFKKK